MRKHSLLVIALVTVGCSLDTSPDPSGLSRGSVTPMSGGADVGVVTQAVCEEQEIVCPAGPQGPVGLTGPQGGMGPQGPVGPTGPTGPRGLMGPQGPQGEPGAQGIPGPQGAPGMPGARGIQGPPGARGEQGSTGAQGEQGPVGPAGPAGPSGALDPGALYIKTLGITKNGNANDEVIARCDAGDVALSGYCDSVQGWQLISVGLVGGGIEPEGWRCGWYHASYISATAGVRCLDTTP